MRCEKSQRTYFKNKCSLIRSIPSSSCYQNNNRKSCKSIIVHGLVTRVTLARSLWRRLGDSLLEVSEPASDFILVPQYVSVIGLRFPMLHSVQTPRKMFQ